jgi:hypothetical protein
MNTIDYIIRGVCESEPPANPDAGGVVEISIDYLRMILERHLTEGEPVTQSRDAVMEAVRKGFCELQRYSFLKDATGGVRRVPDRSGNWVEHDEVHKLFDPEMVDALIAKDITWQALSKAAG